MSLDREQLVEFGRSVLAPSADSTDREESFPPSVITELAKAGYIGSTLPDGQRLSMADYGELSEEIGRHCGSARNFVAVADMVAGSIARWGTKDQRDTWLARIINGEIVAAFALTEPNVGSDAAAIETTAEVRAGQLTLNGAKQWISFAEVADLFLVFANLDGNPVAVLIERDRPGLTIEPIRDLLGLRGSNLAAVTLTDCVVPDHHIVGRPGFGITMVASTALDLGRYSTAWGSAGIARAALEAATQRAATRHQQGTAIKDHQLVRGLLTDILADAETARLVCQEAGRARDAKEPDALNATLLAKLVASRNAFRAASNAVQVHGAAGIAGAGGVARHLRDAKVMEIIEGTTQIQQHLLADHAIRLGRH